MIGGFGRWFAVRVSAREGKQKLVGALVAVAAVVDLVATNLGTDPHHRTVARALLALGAGLLLVAVIAMIRSRRAT